MLLLYDSLCILKNYQKVIGFDDQQIQCILYQSLYKILGSSLSIAYYSKSELRIQGTIHSIIIEPC